MYKYGLEVFLMTIMMFHLPLLLLNLVSWPSPPCTPLSPPSLLVSLTFNLETNVSKKSICTPHSSRHIPSNLFLGFKGMKWYFLPSVITFHSIFYLSNVYKGEIYASSYWKYFCPQIGCTLLCTMTFVRFVLQLYKGDFFCNRRVKKKFTFGAWQSSNHRYSEDI